MSVSSNKEAEYDPTYPLSRPFITPGGITYRIGVIADLDRDAKREDGVWVSNLQKGYLTWNAKKQTVSITWDENVLLQSRLNFKGRGMELSELNVFNGKLYSCDDKTGILYEIANEEVQPFALIKDGDGNSEKGFKCEWGTVKDKVLYIGGHGKYFANDQGEILHYNDEWVKTVTPKGEVKHINWHDNYEALRKAVGILQPGYMVHESCCWSDVHQKWFFMPRKLSFEIFDDKKDELRCTNLLITSDEYFTNIKVQKIGVLQPSHGFSSFKFIPGTDDTVIVAIKSKEQDDITASYIMVFRIDGTILLDETEFTDMKYEGIEFI